MPALQCPECGERHPLDGLGHSASFRCRGCQRLLKVPEQFRAPAPVEPLAPPDPPTAGAPTAAGPTIAPPEVVTRAPSRAAATAPAPPAPPPAGDVTIPLWIRLLIWVVALPVGFLLVFGAARMLGFLTSRQLIDTFIETGWDRFAALVRLVPFWALVTALIVQGSVTGLVRRRQRRLGLPQGRPQGQVSPEPEPARVVS